MLCSSVPTQASRSCWKATAQLRVQDVNLGAFLAVECVRGVVDAAVALGTLDGQSEALANQLADLLIRYLCRDAGAAA